MENVISDRWKVASSSYLHTFAAISAYIGLKKKFITFKNFNPWVQI